MLNNLINLIISIKSLLVKHGSAIRPFADRRRYLG